MRQLYKEGLYIYFGENEEGVAQQEIIRFDDKVFLVKLPVY